MGPGRGPFGADSADAGLSRPVATGAVSHDGAIRVRAVRWRPAPYRTTARSGSEPRDAARGCTTRWCPILPVDTGTCGSGRERAERAMRVARQSGPRRLIGGSISASPNLRTNAASDRLHTDECAVSHLVPIGFATCPGRRCILRSGCSGAGGGRDAARPLRPSDELRRRAAVSLRHGEGPGRVRGRARSRPRAASRRDFRPLPAASTTHSRTRAIRPGSLSPRQHAC